MLFTKNFFISILVLAICKFFFTISWKIVKSLTWVVLASLIYSILKKIIYSAHTEHTHTLRYYNQKKGEITTSGKKKKTFFTSTKEKKRVEN